MQIIWNVSSSMPSIFISCAYWVWGCGYEYYSYRSHHTPTHSITRPHPRRALSNHVKISKKKIVFHFWITRTLHTHNSFLHRINIILIFWSNAFIFSVSILYWYIRDRGWQRFYEMRKQYPNKSDQFSDVCFLTKKNNDSSAE
jgi:hypothetical protein